MLEHRIHSSTPQPVALVTERTTPVQSLAFSSSLFLFLLTSGSRINFKMDTSGSVVRGIAFSRKFHGNYTRRIANERFAEICRGRDVIQNYA